MTYAFRSSIFQGFLIFPFLRNLTLVKLFNFVSSYQIYREVTTNKSNRCLGVFITPLWRRRRKILKKHILCKQFNIMIMVARRQKKKKVYFRAYQVSLDILSLNSMKTFCVLINNHTFYWLTVSSYQVYKRVTTESKYHV